MLEKHPFGDFIPSNARFLLLGSFVGKVEDGYGWFYGNKRNQFWPIMTEVYKKDLSSKQKQQKFFNAMKIALADVIAECVREDNSNLDMKLKNLVFNLDGVRDILEKNRIERIYFTSRFVENLFKRHFKDLILKHNKVELVTLPSPSPRYATMRKEEKIATYKELMPRLN